jgi:hypothetical protein
MGARQQSTKMETKKETLSPWKMARNQTENVESTQKILRKVKQCKKKTVKWDTQG